MHNPRKLLLSAFEDENNACISELRLNCPENHQYCLVKAVLKCYSNVRIIFAVKLINQQLKRGKKGSELNKAKKLNM